MSTIARPERTRLLEAMLEELVEKGYPGFEVEDAVHRAHLSGAGWSGSLPDKDTCLVEAFEGLADQLRTAIGRGCMSGQGWTERVAGGLRVLLAELARRASAAEALARTFPSIGPTAVAHYQAFIESLAPLLTPGRELAAEVELPGEVELLAAGAVEAIVMARIQAGETTSLPKLGPEILFSLVVPFIGPGAAAEAMEVERARLMKAGGRPAPA